MPTLYYPHNLPFSHSLILAPLRFACSLFLFDISSQKGHLSAITNMDAPLSPSPAADLPDVSQLIWAIAQKGFELEEEFLALQTTLCAPLEALNSTALQRCTKFFVQVLAL